MSRRSGPAMRWPLAYSKPEHRNHLTVTERKQVSMIPPFEFARRAIRLRAPVLLGLAMTFGACNATDNLTSPSNEPVATADPVGTADAPSLSTSFRGGI